MTQSVENRALYINLQLNYQKFVRPLAVNIQHYMITYTISVMITNNFMYIDAKNSFHYFQMSTIWMLDITVP